MAAAARKCGRSMEVGEEGEEEWEEEEWEEEEEEEEEEGERAAARQRRKRACLGARREAVRPETKV